MFNDKRSKRVLLIAHCILNQNAKIDRCAHYAGVIKEVGQILINSNVGLLQMPCPELVCLGLDRQAEPNTATTIASEDTRVAQRMIEDSIKKRCSELADDIIYQVVEYHSHGFEIIGIIGINGSPTCGVETTWANNQEERGSGVFIQILNYGFRRIGISLPMRGIKAFEPQEATDAVLELLGKIDTKRDAAFSNDKRA